VEQPIKLGDRIEVGNTYGDVVRLLGRSTWIRTNNNVVIIVPNSEFINQRVTNWTAKDRQVRISLPVGDSYDSDPKGVREVLLTVAKGHPDVLADPSPEVIRAWGQFAKLRPSGLDDPASTDTCAAAKRSVLRSFRSISKREYRDAVPPARSPHQINR